ncbi:hypothetical protein GF314_13770 [bacterium]|nr:hypothetical protein [bacterium]
MNEFLIEHANFARWGVIYLAGGTIVAAVWSWRFRRLTRAAIRPDELRWEAWRGLTAGLVWLAMLLVVALLMATSAEINVTEVMAMSDAISPRLVAQVEHVRGLMVAPVLGALGLAALVVLLGGLWSGAFAALRSGGRADG